MTTIYPDFGCRYAFMFKDKHLIRELLKSVSDINQDLGDGYTYLMLSVYFKEDGLMQRILEFPSVNIFQKNKKDRSIIDLLFRSLSNKLNSSLPYKNSTPKLESKLSYLITHPKMNLNWQDKHGVSLLMYSIVLCSNGLVYYLINNSNRELQDEQGSSALDYAKKMGRRDISNLLD